MSNERKKVTVDPDTWERGWFGSDDVVFDPDALPDAVWFAAVLDAASYGLEVECCREYDTCEGHDGEGGPCEHEKTSRVDTFLGEGIKYSGHIHNKPANKYGDTWEISYQYDARGYGAIVGIKESDDEETEWGKTIRVGTKFYKVSCYAN